MDVTKFDTMNCEHSCSQSSSLIVQNTVERKIILQAKTIASTGSGCEQARGHQL